MSSSNSKIKKLANYIKNNPNDSFSKFALALEFLKDDQLKKARILFEDIQDKDPEYDGVYYHLGKLYERNGRQEDAMAVYKKGVQVAANNKHKRNVQELKEALAELEIEMQS
jgi:Tfp pilus assembly protein PilF